MTQGTILVTAASGKTGRRVLRRLRDRGIDTRIASRADGFGWARPESWSGLLSGVRAVYVVYAPDVALPQAAAQVAAFARAAREHGVERLVLLSGRGEEGAQAAEAAVRAVMPETTVVQCSFFAQNLSEGELAESVGRGELALPVVDMPEPFVDIEDVADVATAALLETGHEGRTYEVTGPDLLSFAQAAKLIGERTGREVRAVAVPVDEWKAELSAAGMEADLVELLGYIFGEVLDGRNHRAADGVERALGRPAGSFQAFVNREFPAG